MNPSEVANFCAPDEICPECEELEKGPHQILSVDINLLVEQKEMEQFDDIALTNVQMAIRRVYSSTSTIYAHGTLSSPDCNQLLQCLASVLQAQVYEDHVKYGMAPAHSSSPFNHVPSLPSELGGICVVDEGLANREASSDPVLKGLLLAGVVPSVNTIYRFMTFLFNRCQCPIECHVIALVYMNRITAKPNVVVTEQSWRLMWVTAIVIAQKMFDDYPLKTSQLADLLPGLTKHVLRVAEQAVLHLLEFNTGVLPSLYAKYYFELRQLFVAVAGPASWTGPSKPLSLRSEKLLQERAKSRFAQQIQAISDVKAERSSSSARKPSPSSSSSRARQTKTAAPEHKNVGTGQQLVQARSLEDASPLSGGAFYILN